MQPSNNSLKRNLRFIMGTLLNILVLVDVVLSSILKKWSLKFDSDDLSVGEFTSSKVCVFAVYCNTSQDEAEITEILEIIKNMEYEILIVNTGGRKVDFKSAAHVFRKNIGRDLGSLTLGLEILQRQSSLPPEQFLFMNDSVFWGRESLKRIIKRAEASKYMITGVTDSTQRSKHIQSYFFHIKDCSKESLDLFKTKPFVMKRSSVVLGERKISKRMNKTNFSSGVLFPYDFLKSKLSDHKAYYGKSFQDLEDLVKKNVDLNPTIHFWPVLLNESGIMKKSLLANPAKFEPLQDF
jgi:hypothetical protein